MTTKDRIWAGILISVGVIIVIGVIGSALDKDKTPVSKLDVALFDQMFVDDLWRPIIRPSGLFSDFHLSDTRMGVTLIISGDAWYACGYGDKKDFVGTIWGALQSIKRRAGDPDPISILRIEDRWGETLAEGSNLGVKVKR